MLKIFLLTFFSISVTFSQSISTINITGSSRFGSSTLQNWSGVNKGEQYSEGIIDSIYRRIAGRLAYQGYLNPAFTSTVSADADSQNISIDIIVNENQPTFVKQIIITDEDSIAAPEIISSFKFLEGQIFIKDELEETIASALDYYEDSGFPFASVKINSIDFAADSTEGEYSADIYILISSGKKSRIDKVMITGSSGTKDYVIIRELRLEPGELYSQSEINELPRRLNRLRFFEPVPPPQFFINGEQEGVLLINVKEKQTNNFDGIIGYIPGSAAGEKGYITGLVNLSMRNLFGTGRAAAIRWQQFNRYSQEMELKYLEPWLFGLPFNISGSGFQRKQDTTYVLRRFEGAVEYLATEDISAAVTIGSEQVIPTISEIPRFTVFTSSSLSTGVNLKIDTRDDPYAPRQGLLFINSYSFSRKKIFGPGQFITPSTKTRVNLQRLSISLSGFLEIFSRQVVALSLHGRELRGDFFEESDLYRLGGTNTLRGYREDQFLGSRTAWSNLEYRLLLTRRTYAFAFFDTGYFLRNADEALKILKQEGFKIGYGVGLNIETGIGVLGVSFALAKGDSFSDGKIHFGIVNEF